LASDISSKFGSWADNEVFELKSANFTIADYLILLRFRILMHAELSRVKTGNGSKNKMLLVGKFLPAMDQDISCKFGV